jgi:hypothetical protein
MDIFKWVQDVLRETLAFKNGEIRSDIKLERVRPKKKPKLRKRARPRSKLKKAA